MLRPDTAGPCRDDRNHLGQGRMAEPHLNGMEAIIPSNFSHRAEVAGRGSKSCMASLVVHSLHRAFQRQSLIERVVLRNVRTLTFSAVRAH